jgi:phage tail sheath protein FI
MPALLTYPGVYVEEISSGVRSITGVATSITAFAGRALKGPKEPTVINSFSDFQRIFGGLWALSPLGYAVNDFYLNGGGQAIIVRLFHNVKDQPSKALIAANSTPGQIPADITSVTDHISTEAIKSIENDPTEDLLTAVDVTSIQSDINTAVDSYTVESEKDLAVYVGTKIFQKAAQFIGKSIAKCLIAIDEVVDRTNKERAGEIL